jgi:hypothetical protein
VSSELLDVTRLQGALLHDHDLLVAAVARAKEKLEGLYSSDPELSCALEDAQSTTTEIRL